VKSFVKAVEVWVPGAQHLTLDLASSHYGDLIDFQKASVIMQFVYDDGLPGKTWSGAKPIILNDLQNSYFQRGDAAAQAGISCAVSVPFFCGEFLQAVVILFCGGESVSGAIELWANNNENELRLQDGYFGELSRFEWISRKLTIMRGRGLPGNAWEQAKPIVIQDLSNSSSFLRAINAAEAGISTGLAIPFYYSESAVQVLALLSAKGTPIAKCFEIWLRDEEKQCLEFDSGNCSTGEDLTQKYQNTQIKKGEGILGECWLTGRPLVHKNADNRQDVILYLPINKGCQLSAIVSLALS